MRLLAMLCAALAMGGPPMLRRQAPAPVEEKKAPPADSTPMAGEPDPIAPALAEARALIDGGRPADALERLKPLDQAHPRVRLLTGVALYHADRRREAIAALEGVRAQLPEDSIERR